MAKVALSADTITSSTASNHISYRKWEYQYTTATYCTATNALGECIAWGGGDAVYDWNYYTTDATISGNCQASVSNVKVNNASPIVNGDGTSENDSYTISSGEYVSGSHSNASGSVTSGNAKNVFINGKSVSILGSTINTHASTSTTIEGNGSVNVNIG